MRDEVRSDVVGDGGEDIPEGGLGGAKVSEGEGGDVDEGCDCGGEGVDEFNGGVDEVDSRIKVERRWGDKWVMRAVGEDKEEEVDGVGGSLEGAEGGAVGAAWPVGGVRSVEVCDRRVCKVVGEYGVGGDGGGVMRWGDVSGGSCAWCGWQGGVEAALLARGSCQ